MDQQQTLITGGAGFIGSHLADHLLKHGDRVRVLDDLSTGRLENLAAHTDSPHLSITIASVCDEARVESLAALACWNAVLASLSRA